MAPFLVALIVLRRFTNVPARMLVIGAGVGVLLVSLRVLYAYPSIIRSLRFFRVELDDEGLTVDSLTTSGHVPRAAIRRVVETPGVMGGLSIDVDDFVDGGGVPIGKRPTRAEVVDVIVVPRGGDRYADLVLALAAIVPVEVAPTRSRTRRYVWVAGAIVLAALVPFAIDGAHVRSPAVPLGIVLVLWIVIRVSLRRG